MRLKSFSKFEDDISNLKLAATEAVNKAVRESRALGLPITYANNGDILKESPDGSVQKLGEIDRHYTPRKITKGQILYVKRS